MALIAPVLGMTLGVFLMKPVYGGRAGCHHRKRPHRRRGELRICWRHRDAGCAAGMDYAGHLCVPEHLEFYRRKHDIQRAAQGAATVMTQIAATGMTRAGVGAAVSLLLMIPPIVVFVIVISPEQHRGNDGQLRHQGIRGQRLKTSLCRRLLCAACRRCCCLQRAGPAGGGRTGTG